MAKKKYRATPINNPQIEPSDVIIEDVPVYSYIIPKGTSRKEIKDLASDLAYYGNIQNPTVENDSNAPKYRTIDDYGKIDTREHRILHRAYDRYSAKKERQKLENTPLYVVKTWDEDKQKQWFTAQMNKGAKAVLPPLLGTMSIPSALSAAVASPLAFTLGMAGGLGGSHIGENIGREIDERRHGLSDAELYGNVIGGTIGGAIGGAVGNYAGNRIVSTLGNRWRGKNSWKWGNEYQNYWKKQNALGEKPMDIAEWIKTYKQSPLEELTTHHATIGKSQYINGDYSNWFSKSVSPKSGLVGVAFNSMMRLNPPSKETLTNWSNRSQLHRWIAGGDDLITQIYPKLEDFSDLNTPRRFSTTQNPYFTSNGVHPGKSNLMWYSKGDGYFVKGVNGNPIRPHITLVVNPEGLTIQRDPFQRGISTVASDIVVSSGKLPYKNIKFAVEYDPSLKTFVRYIFQAPDAN